MSEIRGTRRKVGIVCGGEGRLVRKREQVSDPKAGVKLLVMIHWNLSPATDMMVAGPHFPVFFLQSSLTSLSFPLLSLLDFNPRDLLLNFLFWGRGLPMHLHLFLNQCLFDTKIHKKILVLFLIAAPSFFFLNGESFSATNCMWS